MTPTPSKPMEDPDGFSIDEDAPRTPEPVSSVELNFDDLLADAPETPLGAPELDAPRAPAPGLLAPWPVSNAPSASGGHVPLLGGLTVLLAGQAAAGYQAQVELAGFNAAVAQNGVEALAGLDVITPDLVVTALALGDLSGLELMKAAQAVHPQVKFIVVDDPAQAQQIVTVLGEGAVAFVPTGSPPERLLSAIRTAGAKSPKTAKAGHKLSPITPPGGNLQLAGFSTPTPAGRPLGSFPLNATPASGHTFGRPTTPMRMAATPGPAGNAAALAQQQFAQGVPTTVGGGAVQGGGGDLLAARAQVNALENELHQIRSQFSLTQGELAAARAREGSLESQLAAMQQRAQSAEAVAQQRLSADGAAASDTQRLKAVAATAQSKLAAAETELASAKAKGAALEGDMAALREKLVNADAAARAATSAKPAMDERSQAEIKRLVEAVAPLAWGLEQAIDYLERTTSGADREAHVRQLKLLQKVLAKLKDKAG